MRTDETARLDAGRFGLWRSDGTAAGTRLPAAATPGSDSSWCIPRRTFLGDDADVVIISVNAPSSGSARLAGSLGPSDTTGLARCVAVLLDGLELRHAWRVSDDGFESGDAATWSGVVP